MKVLFAVHDEKVSLSIVKKYQKEYKEIISYKNVYYFNTILKEIQRDKSYDRIIIDEDLEEFTSKSYEEDDRFIFNKLDSITDEASNSNDKDVPIILICTERRTKSEDFLVKLFGIGIYNAIIGNDRSTDEVCRLINSPRSKKEAKNYYNINSKKVEYNPEDENDVSEEEMQHILSYFKKLGKNPEKYDECFKKIVSQYNDQQMKTIVAILPKNVKNVLQDVSSEYQKYAPKSNTRVTRTAKAKKNIKEEQTSNQKLLNSNNNSSRRNIVIPSSVDKNIIKKVTLKKPVSVFENQYEDDYDDDYDDYDDYDDNIEDLNEEIVTTNPKRRGRPSKKAIIEEDDMPKTQMGRTSNMPENEEIQTDDETDDETDNILPGMDDIYTNNQSAAMKEQYKPIDESLLRPEPIGGGNLSDSDDEEDDDDDNYELYDLETETNYSEVNKRNEEETNQFDDYDAQNTNQGYNTVYQNKYEQEDNYERNNSSNSQLEKNNYEQYYNDYDTTNYDNLLSSDKKVVAFVGTSKNGTSFIVNNIAKILSDNGIDTAILDATQNKNSYYIYNNNDDSLRTDAANSLEDLTHGIRGGMKVSRNLSVYSEIPGQNSSKINEVGPILENLAKNYSATLIDCDFSTPYGYFANAQEIYLVQSMDVLTIQPITAFLKELKNRDILDQKKIRIIINKAVRLRGITPKQIVGGMSRYNNPEMSMMTELFDRNAIIPIEIPFDVDVYAKYLEGLAECNVSINKYPRDFQNILNKLSNIIYPLLPARKSKEKSPRGYQYSNGYSNGFSNNVNNTLNNMRKKY